ncbi:undecaprenyl-phosphate glucose phosphotransferase [Pedobacter sp. HMWF019]|uniref:exopolysaccharide biosynthesis polyprenyl glycosylphosphotransferase n=1 Tax=Pedobacter sp. HMWF019 TaxID=2056856 RepID=UPI000D3A030E|nr:exopolysaccharide biosynthesis polyprenyl glycosylphosphotransferase [Pedobacter sp. HMWF019]PTT02670.1 undecaprenyl-phosphate glucose phosphotransferase [Pedobacter sp. HMWF019]
MQTRYVYLLKYILLITDLLLLNTLYYGAFHITLFLGKSISQEINIHYIVVCNLIWLFNTAVFGLYTFHGSGTLEKIYRGTWKSVALHIVLFAGYLLLAKNVGFSKTFLVVFYSMLTLVFILNRFIVTVIQYKFLNKLNWAKKVAVMGSNPTAKRISAYFEKQKDVQFYGCVCEDEHLYALRRTGVSKTTSLKLAEAAGQGVVDVYVAVRMDRTKIIRPLILEAEKLCLRLKFIPDFGISVSGYPYTLSHLDGEFPILTVRNEPLDEVSNRFKKRLFDVVFSTLVIVFVLSWLYPVLALLIKLESKGPVLFKQLRTGRNDEAFWCFKFRSMYVNEASDIQQAQKNDNRITALGKFLRRTSLDEMPQFFNVFMGTMSIVGPRPHMLKHTKDYRAIINQYMVRQLLKPGITGLAQVNGFRGETKTKEAMEDRVKFDIHYLENWSSMMDVKIIFMTVINLVSNEHSGD